LRKEDHRLIGQSLDPVQVGPSAPIPSRPDLRVGTARFMVWPENILKSGDCGVYPNCSRNVFDLGQIHFQVTIMYALLHHNGVGCNFLRVVSVQPKLMLGLAFQAAPQYRGTCYIALAVAHVEEPNKSEVTASSQVIRG
jgi:hypothetical protein